MSTAALLIEIGCEEIPARMIAPAAAELGRRIGEILDQAALAHGALTVWGGSRRLAVRIEDVLGRQGDREQLTLGPPAAIAFDSAGRPTTAALGFAKKQGIAADLLTTIENEKGAYAGVRTHVAGRSLGEILAEALPPAVSGMSFPKTMRWAEGRHRWVRPVHWVVALHGALSLPIELFGIATTGGSMGHRFLAAGPVPLRHADDYVAALERARVVVDPAVRRVRLCEALEGGASELGGRLLEDPGLLDEVIDLVEWPGVVAGRFETKFLDLPRELLVTTLRHHQKCFSVQDDAGTLVSGFLAVTNTMGDPGGHIRRGNEWVVGGRLEDARFFWNEDRQAPLESRLPRLAGVVFHAKCGSYADKSERLESLALEIARALELGEADGRTVRRAARLAKADLVTALVGEFPELQGIIGGLLLGAEGAEPEVAHAVYQHYRPSGRSDAIPPTTTACVVALADKLDTVTQLIGAGERPTGSRDPLGLRRVANGIFRIVIERSMPLSLQTLWDLTPGQHADVLTFFQERLFAFLKEEGYSAPEIWAVVRPRISEYEFHTWSLADLVARLEAIKQVRGRDDFRHLVKLTERVDNILTKNAETFLHLVEQGGLPAPMESAEAALDLERLLERCEPIVARESERRSYSEIVAVLSSLIEPVDRFFQDVLVLDPADPAATLRRYDLLVRSRNLLTRHFDIRELAGEAERRAA